MLKWMDMSCEGDLRELLGFEFETCNFLSYCVISGSVAQLVKH